MVVDGLEDGRSLTTKALKGAGTRDRKTSKIPKTIEIINLSTILIFFSLQFSL